MLVDKFVAFVGLAGDHDDLLRIEFELGAGGAQGVDCALRALGIGVETIERFHSAISVGSGPSSIKP